MFMLFYQGIMMSNNKELCNDAENVVSVHLFCVICVDVNCNQKAKFVDPVFLLSDKTRSVTHSCWRLIFSQKLQVKSSLLYSRIATKFIYFISPWLHIWWKVHKKRKITWVDVPGVPFKNQKSNCRKCQPAHEHVSRLTLATGLIIIQLWMENMLSVFYINQIAYADKSSEFIYSLQRWDDDQFCAIR